MKPENAEKLLTTNLRIALQRRGAKARLAKLCGVKPNTVTNWAQGNYSPSVSQLGKIAAALSVTVPELFAGPAEEDDLNSQTSAVVSLPHVNTSSGERNATVESVEARLLADERRNREQVTRELLEMQEQLLRLIERQDHFGELEQPGTPRTVRRRGNRKAG